MRISFVILFCLLISCRKEAYTYKVTPEKVITGVPPGTIQIDESLYLDISETTTGDWNEYLSWLKRVYGTRSAEFLAAQPDSLIWRSLSTDPEFPAIYMNHVIYSDYPMIGLTQQQALAYTKWRTDRVFEYLLSENGILSYDTHPTRQNIFSIERFYKDPKYQKYQHLPYPEYSMLPVKKWHYLIERSDCINEYNIKSCRQRTFSYKLWTRPVYCDELIDHGRMVVRSLEKTEALNRLVPVNCHTCKKDVIFHMRGNVREMTDVKGVVAGGGWMDSFETIMKTSFDISAEANAWTGFRNVCTWKYYKK